MGIQLVGVGHYLPETIRSSADIERELGRGEGKVFRSTGIRERRAAGPRETSWVMGTHAAQAALAHAGLQPSDIDLLVAHISQPELDYPDIAWPLARDLGLSPSCAVMGVRFGCTGFVGSLHVARQFLETGAAKCALVVCAEVMHWHAQSYPRSAPILGDAAGAAIFRPGRPGEGRGVIASFVGNLASHIGECLVVNDHLDRSAWPQLSPGLAEEFGDAPYSPRGTMSFWNGGDIFKQAIEHMTAAVQRVLDETGLGIDDIDHFLFHQANIRIIKGVARHLDLPLDKAPVHIETVGNTASASIPVLLSQELHAGRIQAGQRLVFVGFGTGYSFGAAVMEL